MNGHQTATISTLIEMLQEAQTEHGDVPVVFSTDEEGNSFNTVDYNGNSDNTFSLQNGFLVIYPATERLELDEIAGYVAEDETDDEDYYDDYEEDEYTLDDYMSSQQDY